MDRLAALADILPPPTPAPLPPLPWWQMPWVAWSLLAVLLLLTWALLAWRRGKRWRQLCARARAVQGDGVATASAAVELATSVRRCWPEAEWPQTLRANFDALRFAPRPDPALLRLVARGVQTAAARAARAAWWSRASAQRRYVQTMRDLTPEST
ncbi:MAG: hypothetical protein AB1412_14255 [Pseudomonadota bacterium]